MLTDFFSYRVRLLRVNYSDTERRGESDLEYAFAVESEHAMARRLGGDLVTIGGLPKSRLNEEHAAVVCIFQYISGSRASAAV